MRLVALVACVLVRAYAAEDDAVSRAVEALGRGDLSSAEQILQTQLRAQPNDGAALEVLGVVLDQEKKFTAADAIYRRALAISPHSPPLLNNYGNHLLATGKGKQAQKVFLEVISINAGNANALVQLARIALERKAAAEAIGYLDRVPADIRDRPDVAILRMQTDYALGRTKEADAILARVSSAVHTEGSQNFALGVALASVGQYDKAETFFSRAVEAVPGNFEALYNLGLAASHAGHHERARSVLQQALEQQPQNVDVLYDLAAVNTALDGKDAALQLLARASRIAPQRADVLQLLARLSAELGYFADAVQAWNEYLKILPDNDVARRERAFAETAIGENMQEGLADLNVFVRKHPNDPVGHYELGTAETLKQPDLASKEFDRALALKPDFTGARVTRGLLLYRQGKPEAALADFEAAAKGEPNNGVILDRLGEIYMSLDRVGDALPVLRRAAELMPANSTVLLHLGRALSKAGQVQEASTVFARCRELGPNKSALPHPLGLIDFLSLSPEEQIAKYRAGVERTVRNNPANVEAQVRYLSILLDEGKTTEAAAVSRRIATLQSTAPLLAQAAGALLAGGQYSVAKELLESSGASAHSSGDLLLDLAIANFHAVNAQAGLREMDRIPPGERNGDYYLARAQMLEADGRWPEAEQSLQQARRTNSARPELYCQTAILLLKDHHTSEALQLLEQAARTFSNDPEILLLKAITLEVMGKRDGSALVLRQIENRWPDWYKVWAVHALVLESSQQYEEAHSIKETAIALGAPAALETKPPAGAEELLDAILALFRL